MLKQERAGRIIEREIAVSQTATRRQYPKLRLRAIALALRVWFGNAGGDLEFSALTLNFERDRRESGRGSNQHIHALCPSQGPAFLWIGLDK